MKRSIASGRTRCGISCCAKCRSMPTAPSRTNGSTNATTPTSRTRSGNLASRAISMVEKYCDGIVPLGTAARGELDRADLVDLAEYHAALQGGSLLLHEAIKRVMSCVARGNEFVQSSQPWALAKNPERRGELESVLAAIMRQLARHAIHLAPVIPNKAQELWVQLGGPGRVEDQRFANVDTLDVTGWRVAKGASLFPKPLPQTSAQ